MAYTKQTWENLPSQTTPINADRLTHIEDGIFNAAATADTAASNASSAISGLADKVDKVEGKGLSTNDFTDALKTKLDNIEAGAEVNVQSDWNEADSSSDAFILNKPTLGTSAYKNSTSVVTDSTDLVESGAVENIIGWGNKNKLNKEDIYSKHSNLSVTQLATGINITANSGATWASVVYKLNIKPNADYIVSSDVDLTDGIVFFQLKHGTTTVKTGTAITESGQLTLDFNLAYNDEVYLHIFVSNATAYLTNADLNNFQLEKGSTATAYEPYHASVSDSLAEKADNSVIGTVEDGATASQAYAVGSHAIRNGAFITWKNAKAQGETINDASDYTSGDVASAILNVKKVSFTWTPQSAGSDITIFNIATGLPASRVVGIFVNAGTTNGYGVCPTIFDNNIPVIIHQTAGIGSTSVTGTATILYI